uniref:DUF3719 domain-containing protein n=1 Tax=Onchocerca volvulus TaxID=6282 RepID=A0A8R1XR10_ONCVO
MISDGTKTKEHFLIRAERSIYEGEPMSDDEVEIECRIWAKTLPHLRICGKSINKNYNKKVKSMNEDIIDQLIQDFLWNSFPDLSNKEQKRKKSQSDKLTNKMHEKQIKTTKHFTLPAISNCHHNCLSHYTACLK